MKKSPFISITGIKLKEKLRLERYKTEAVLSSSEIGFRARSKTQEYLGIVVIGFLGKNHFAKESEYIAIIFVAEDRK